MITSFIIYSMHHMVKPSYAQSAAGFGDRNLLISNFRARDYPWQPILCVRKESIASSSSLRVVFDRNDNVLVGFDDKIEPPALGNPGLPQAGRFVVFLGVERGV